MIVDPRSAPAILSRMMREGRKVDQRTTLAKSHRAILQALADGWGCDLAEMPPFARLVADRVGIVALRLLVHERQVIASEATDTTDRQLVALGQAFRKGVETLMQMKRQLHNNADIPDVAEHVRRRLAEIATMEAQQEAE